MYIFLSILILFINIIVISCNSEIGILTISIYCVVWIFITLFVLSRFVNDKINEESQNNTTVIQIVELLPIYSQQSPQLLSSSSLSSSSLPLPSYKSNSSVQEYDSRSI